MEKCVSCNLGYNSNHLEPKGNPNNPDYYVIGYVSSELEVSNNNPFDSNSNRANSYLSGVLSSLQINEMNARFNKMIRCVSENRNISEDHKNACSKYLIDDIINCNPKIIIGLGSEVGALFLKDRFRYINTARGRLFDIELNGNQYKFLVTYSPTYITKSYDNPEESQDMTEFANLFYSDLSYCVKYVNGELVDISTKDLRYAMTYDEYKKYFDEYLKDAELPSYDIESNAKDPRCSDFRIVGFSLAPDASTGMYIIRKTLEYSMPNEDWEKCVKLTKEYLSSRTCLVHNIMYEKPATLNEWNLNIVNFEDSLIKARLLLGGKTGAGLKEQCILNLGYPEWDADLGEYMSEFGVLWGNLSHTPAGNHRWDFDYLQEHGFVDLLNEYIRRDEFSKQMIQKQSQGIELTKEENELWKVSYMDKRTDECYRAMQSLEALICNYYEPDEIGHILQLIGEEVINLIEIHYEGILPYSSIPMKIITKYGAMDSVGTQDLNIFLSNRLTNESSESVDLWRGYKIAKQHFIIGSYLEMNGLYWNDEVAQENKDWLDSTAKQSMINMLLSGFLDEEIYQNSMFILQDYVQNNMMDYVKQVLGDFEMQKSGIKLLSTGRRISYKNIIWELPEEFRLSMKDFVIEESKKRIVNNELHPHFDSFKYLFNPASNKNTPILNRIFITNDLQMGYVVAKINDLLDSEEFSIDSVPMPDKYVFLAVKNIRSYNKEAEAYNKSDECTEKKELISSRQVFEKVNATLQQISVQSKLLINIITDAVHYKLEGTSEPIMLGLFSYFEAMGIDTEDESTWTPEFRFLWDFRMYKKCIKLISSYIDGSKIGRGSVWMINKEDVESNKTLPIRTDKYNWESKPKNKVYLMQPSWMVMTAETLRWRSGVHTLPMGRTVKGMYTSRYKGGVIAAPDYSQLEVRITAGLSQCKALLDAYKNGEDVHLRTAMGIFNKPADQITKVERRFSKMGTFRILYGSTPEGFASQFLDGDVEMARRIFEGFYSTYPEVKEWMDKRHREVEMTGKVSCENIGYYIYIDRDGPEGLEGAYRKAGNYPIQSQGSMTAGYVLSQINNFCMENNFYTRPICFIHDSLEFDIHPRELFSVSPVIMKMMNDIPINEFGIPTEADLTLGTSMGMENEVKKMEFSEDGNEATFILEGFEDDLDQMYEHWRDNAGYRLVEIEDVGEKEPVYTRKRELFQEKLALGPFIGTTRNLMQRKFHIVMD